MTSRRPAEGTQRWMQDGLTVTADRHCNLERLMLLMVCLSLFRLQMNESVLKGQKNLKDNAFLIH